MNFDHAFFARTLCESIITRPNLIQYISLVVFPLYAFSLYDAFSCLIAFSIHPLSFMYNAYHQTHLATVFDIYCMPPIENSISKTQ